MIKFLSLSSGSSGNCFYLGTDGYGILIDAGIPVRSIKKFLKDEGILMESIMALFITHDHADHIRSAGTVGEKLFKPVYATQLVHEGMNCSYCMTERLRSSRRVIEPGVPVRVKDLVVECFKVPHDSRENVGYQIRVDGKTFCFITDMGDTNEEIESRIRESDYLVIEANYDEHMLEVGPYPQYLKDRIRGGHGHLANHMTADILRRNCSDRQKAIFLCHLSKENNTPEVAQKTVSEALESAGLTPGNGLILKALNRIVPTGPFVW